MRATDVQALLYASCAILVCASVVVPYFFGVRPKTPRQRAYVTAAVAFLTWLLTGFVFLR